MGRKLICVVSLILALGSCAPEGPSAFVDINLEPDSSCTFTIGGGDVVGLASGVYDIATGGPGSSVSNVCANPYLLALRVNSQLRTNYDMELGRAEPNVLQVREAVVTLRNRDGSPIGFGDQGASDSLPNPFKVNTNVSVPPTDTEEPSFGIVFVEGIPLPYASFLRNFRNDQILIEVQLVGTTLGDVEVEFQPYLYPVRICEGCRTRCGSEEDKEEDLGDLAGDTCQDNAGFDLRWCYDPYCGSAGG